MLEKLKIEAFVLAGGKSSRMGQDKGLAVLNGKPMIAYILETLELLKLPAKIITNHPCYEQFGVAVCKDVVADKGPMGGLFTAFENTKADVVLLTSCDMPLILPEALKALLSALHPARIVAVEVSGKLNPLFALYPRRLKEQLIVNITAGELRMTDFIQNNHHHLIDVAGLGIADCFKNINTPQDLEEVGRLL